MFDDFGSAEISAYWADADVLAYVRKSIVLGEVDLISVAKQEDIINQ
jgi:hypothetical protein